MPITTANSKQYFRFMWSHHHWLHRSAVKIFNYIMRYVPFSIKYNIGVARRKNKFPYKLINSGKTIIQVGAPADTLQSGRSRGMYFALFTGNTGKAVIVEPESYSKELFEKYRKEQNLPQISFYHAGAWSEKKTLKFYIDPTHPATNFTEGVRHYSDQEMAAYQLIEMPANTVDNISKELNLKNVFMVSLTTNGAEPDILKGMKGLIEGGLPYICLARTGEKYFELMSQYGYELHAYDDRGYTFKQNGYQPTTS